MTFLDEESIQYSLFIILACYLAIPLIINAYYWIRGPYLSSHYNPIDKFILSIGNLFRSTKSNDNHDDHHKDEIQSIFHGSEGLLCMILIRIYFTYLTFANINLFDNLSVILIFSQSYDIGYRMVLLYTFATISLFTIQSDFIYIESKDIVHVVLLISIPWIIFILHSHWKLSRADTEIITMMILYGTSYVLVREVEAAAVRDYSIGNHYDHNHYDRYWQSTNPVSIENSIAFGMYTIITILWLGILFQSYILLLKSFPTSDSRMIKIAVMIALLAIFIVNYIPIFYRCEDLYYWMIAILTTQNYFRFRICIVWILCIILTIPVAGYISHRWSKTSSRKIFHILSVVMFAPVTIDCPDFMIMAYGVAIGTFLLIEFSRMFLYGDLINKNPPMITSTVSISPFNLFHKGMERIATYFHQFLDSRDQNQDRGMILSHLYLLLGCAIPLYFISFVEISRLCRRFILIHIPIIRQFGWITVGLGDAIGAMYGYSYGKHRWYHSSKTMEGTIAAIISMILAFDLVVCLEDIRNETSDIFSLKNERYFVLKILIGSVTMIIVGLAEAFTTENDNLIMPLIACIVY